MLVFAASSYPKGIADRQSIANHIVNYVDNFLSLDSPQWHRIVSSARDNRVYLVVAFSQRASWPCRLSDHAIEIHVLTAYRYPR